jgi:glycosyltransferase involved in cell wall biosynthesis
VRSGEQKESRAAGPVSVTMITRDASRYLAESLGALKHFDEIIVLDNGSVDETIEIARRFSNVKVFESPFIGFGPLKNLAASYAKNDWILSVDSDEVFSEELVDEIFSLGLDKKRVYAIVRDNYYRQKLIRCCGWEDDRVDRLYHRKEVRFNDNQVHESLIFPEGAARVTLQYRFKHYTYRSSEELIAKMQHYSTLWARDFTGKKSASPVKAALRSLFAFVKFYFFKKGFLNGYEGLLISVTNANNVFYKYIKLYEANRESKERDEDTH